MSLLYSLHPAVKSTSSLLFSKYLLSFVFFSFRSSSQHENADLIHSMKMQIFFCPWNCISSFSRSSSSIAIPSWIVAASTVPACAKTKWVVQTQPGSTTHLSCDSAKKNRDEIARVLTFFYDSTWNPILCTTRIWQCVRESMCLRYTLAYIIYLYIKS